MTDTRDDLVLSFKPHPGYDAPLLVFKAGTVAELADKVAALEAVGMFALIANADTAFKAAWNLGKQLGATPMEHPSTVAANQAQQPPWEANQPQQTQYAPPPAQYQPTQPTQPAAPPTGRQATPPGMVAPTCPHGTKTYVIGQYGPFWGCPGQRNDPGRCKPQKAA